MKLGFGLIGTMLILPCGVFAQSRLDTPDSIIAAVRSSGAKAVIAAMVSDKTWDTPFLSGVAHADSHWLDAASVLAPGVDAGSSEDLSDALAQAILLNPEVALKTARLVWWSHGEQLCLFGIDSELPGGVSTYVARLQIALDRSFSSQFTAVKSECLHGIEATRRTLKAQSEHVG